MTDEQYQEIAKQISLNDQDAFDFLCKFTNIANTWDDVWDQDKEVTKESMDDVLSDLAFDLSRNPFYKKHQSILEAHLFLTWNGWKAANEWAHNVDKFKKIYAFFLKDFCCFEIEHLVAWLVGGKSHAKKMNLIIREMASSQLREELPKLE